MGEFSVHYRQKVNVADLPAEAAKGKGTVEIQSPQLIAQNPPVRFQYLPLQLSDSAGLFRCFHVVLSIP